MSIVLRPGKTADAEACGTICYEAFKALGTAHNFPPGSDRLSAVNTIVRTSARMSTAEAQT
jgi:hypothetical protein